MLVAALRWRLADAPLERDEGVYGYIAQRVLEGGLPYRDGWEMKPPVIYCVYAAALELFGHTAEALRFAGIFAVLLTMVLLFGFGSSIWNSFVGAVAAAVYGVTVSGPFVNGFTANTEVFVNVFAVACAWAAWDGLRRGKCVQWFLAGVFAGLAFMTKQPALLQVLLVGVAVALWAYRQGERSVRRFFNAGAAAAGGFLVAVLPWFIFFLGRGALAEFLDAAYAYPWLYSTKLPLGVGLTRGIKALSRIVPGNLITWVLACCSLGALVSKKADDRDRLIPVWLLCGAVSVSLGLYFYGHYFQMVIPAVALASARVLDTIRHRLRKNMRWAAGAIALVMVALPLGAHADYFFRMPGTQVCRMQYGGNPFPEAVGIGRYLASHTTPDETVFILGSEAEILFYARRRSASRYIQVYPLFMPVASAQVRKRQEEVVDAVRSACPRYIIVVRIASSQLIHKGSDTYLITKLQDMLRNDYDLDAMVLDVKANGITRRVFVTADEARFLPPQVSGSAVIRLFRRRDVSPPAMSAPLETG